MTEQHRKALWDDAHTVVVKVGTRVLTDERGYLAPRRVEHLAEQLVDLRRSRRVVLVSSGAVASGMSSLGYAKRPAGLAELQAVAAVGQAKLIQAYDHEFRRHACPAAGPDQTFHAAQVLLGADDLHQRAGYLNVRNTLLRLMEYAHVLPVINENDTVSVEELQTTFGDNDRLAALVANLLRAPLLVILSTVDGVYDDRSQVIPVVSQVDDRVWSFVCDQKTGLSKGGMSSKLKSASLCTGSGETVIIANGRTERILPRLLAGESLGTLLLPHGPSLSPLKRWIGFPAKARGSLVVDAGAREAILDRGVSLLAVGVKVVRGEFHKGDVVSICLEEEGAVREIARGLSNYDASDLERIRGLKSQEIAAVLGHRPYEEVVHRNNMVLVEGGAPSHSPRRSRRLN